MKTVNHALSGNRIARSSCQVILLLIVLVLQDLSLLAGGPRAWYLGPASNQIIEKHRETFQVPGISVAIAQAGQLVYQQGFGYQDRESQLAATPETRYRLASISKSITSVLVMMLVQQEKLQLEQPLGHYLPDLSRVHRSVSLSQLLSHQSGIRHYQAGDPDSLKFEYCHKAMKFFQDDPLKFQPGEKFLYSTHAYTVLGAALEKATGKSFRQLVLEEITNKQHLPSLRPEDRSVRDPRRAVLYHNVAKKTSTASKTPAIKNVRATPDNISWKCPGGGLESTAPDLCRFALQLLHGSILTQENRQLLWTPRKLNNGKITSYGLGWVIGSTKDHHYVAHSGSQLGARSYLRIYPDADLVVVILSNCGSHRPQDLGDTLSQLILENPLPARRMLLRRRSR